MGSSWPMAALWRHPCWPLYHPWLAAAALHESRLAGCHQAQQSSAHPGVFTCICKCVSLADPASHSCTQAALPWQHPAAPADLKEPLPTLVCIPWLPQGGHRPDYAQASALTLTLSTSTPCHPLPTPGMQATATTRWPQCLSTPGPTPMRCPTRGTRNLKTTPGPRTRWQLSLLWRHPWSGMRTSRSSATS